MSGTHPKNTSGAGNGNQTPAAAPIPSIEEKNKKIQRETLMEKIRAKYRNKPKSYEEIKKSVRMYFIEKHYPMDPLCKANLQAALDKLQHYIKVTSRHGLVERLESLSRQLGLKFMEDQQTLFISTDMFYVEILLDATGNLNDVKVHHECKIEQQSNTSASSLELLNCLKAGDFADFTVQLEGLSSIYQLNAEPKVKKKAFVALQAMETDIYNYYQHQLQQISGSSDSYHIMNSCSLGLVLQRRGGHPMKLTYFCPPLHLVETNTKADDVASSSGTASREFSIEQVMKSPSALSATLNLEGSSANKLQILPIVGFTSESGLPLDQPTYAPLTQVNSMLMPATYVLRLSKPMPVCVESLRALGLPGLPSLPSPEATPTVMNLIVQTASRQMIKSTQKGLYVNLPKETHCYFFTDNRRLQGTLISSLPFTEPTQVPKIIAFLKKQALFYTLLSSCVREQQKQYNDMDSTVILEVTAVSLNQITVELQHPYEESLATVDFLLDEGQASCTIYCLTNDYEELSQKLTRTVRQVVSIPMVIYKLLKCWDEEHQQKLHGAIGSSSGTGSGTAGGFSSAGAGGNGGMPGPSNFGQFTMESGAGEGSSGTGGGFANVSSMKMDSKVRSLADAFAASTSAAAALAGLINLKRETDPQGPGGSSPVPSGSSATTSKSSDNEIADKYKNIWKDKTPNLKHCVSITPIAGDGKPPLQQQQQPQQVDVQRTGGIEIIPLNAPAVVAATSSAGSPATTITITPITGGSKEATKDTKKTLISANAPKRPHESSTSSSTASTTSTGTSSTSSCSSDAQKEKKRKKKRDDSPMGPPEKIYSRQNSPAAGGMADASAVGGVVRKFSSPAAAASSSPKAGTSAAAAAALGLMAGQPSARPSPKHSPVYSSPKHTSSSNTASNSPKSPFGTLSPKHGSSGKPSMSTLKSATAATSLSLSPKGEKSLAASIGGGSSASHSLPLAPSGSGSSSSANPSMMRPVPPLASTSSQLPVAIKKDKLMASTSASGAPPGAVAAAVAALKSCQQQQQQQHQQQQLKSSVASLSHLAAGGNLSSYAAPAAATVELNALRKVMAGAGVGPVMGAAAGTVGAVSLMTSTAASTATTPTTTTAVTAAADSAGSAAPAATVTLETGLGLALGLGVGAGVGPAPAATAAPTTTTSTQQQLLQQGAAPISSDNASSSSSSSSTSSSSIIPSTSSGYMVKPSSQEGLKLTINKTGTAKRESKGGSTGSSSSSSSSSTSSKKQHTGLKPGVNSGPASKKAPLLGSGPGAGAGGSSSSKHLFQKANSSGNLSTKLSGASTSTGGLPLTKSNSTNTFQEHGVPRRRPSMGSSGGVGVPRKPPSAASGSASASGSGVTVGAGRMSPAALSGSMSQPPPRFDHHTDMMTILQYASPTMAASMEGFIKGLHNKFQIPKLSQRSSGNSSAAGQSSSGTDQTTAATASSSSSPASTSTPSATQEQQLNADLSALASSITVTPSSSSGSQNPPAAASPAASDMLLNLSSTGEEAGAGDGIDEELLASLAGE